MITITIPLWVFWIFMGLFTVHIVLDFLLLKVKKEIHEKQTENHNETKNR